MKNIAKKLKEGGSGIKKTVVILIIVVLLGVVIATCVFHEHKYGEWAVVVAPSCGEKGLETRKCFCGSADSRYLPPTNEHVFGDWKPSTYNVCPANKKEEKSCKVCSKTESRLMAVQGEHVYSEVKVNKNATCNEAGELLRYCNCGEYIKEEIYASHIIVTEEPIFPTEAEVGYTKGVYCSFCHKVWQERKTVGKLTEQQEDILSHLGYEGDPEKGISLKWLSHEKYYGDVFGFLVDAVYEGEKRRYSFFAEDCDLGMDLFEKSGKYTLSVYPVSKGGIKGNSKNLEINWYPEIIGLEFPRVEITTLNGELPACKRIDHPEGSWGIGITDANYVSSIVSVYNGDNDLLYCSSKNDFDKSKIKVRGNTSALGRKHPYKIKLDDKADLLEGLVKRQEGVDYGQKEWILLSEGKNYSYITGSAVADLVGCDWTPEFCYVTLFVNGDYRGLYILIESIEPGEGTVDISEEGYIVEMDSYWWNEDLHFTTPISENSAVRLTFKYPDSDDIDSNSKEYLYIKEYMILLENSLLSGKGGNQYLDYESAVKWLLTHDILGTYDSGGSNMFMTKYDSTEASIIHFGPLWDYGTVYSYDAQRFARIRTGKFFYIYLLVKDREFMDMYKERYSQVKDHVIDAVVRELERYDNEVHSKLLEYETKRWKSEVHTAEMEIELTREWLVEHLEWMDKKL